MKLRYWLLSLVAATSVTSLALACSWDYAIWGIRSKSADPLFRFIRNGKAGYIDRAGQVVIPPTLKVTGNHDGEFHGGRLLINDGQYFDMTGKRVIDRNPYAGWEFFDGLATAQAERGGKWGYVDTSGKFVIPPRFDCCPDRFSNGLAKIEIGERIAYIDKTGTLVLLPSFLEGTRFLDNRAWVVIEGPCKYFSPDSVCPEPATTLPRSATHEPSGACRYALIDKSGTVLSEKRFDGVGDFSEGLAPVRIGALWGFVNESGTIVIEPRFKSAAPFSEGLAVVGFESGGRFFQYGYINRSGVLLIQPQFGAASSFSEGVAAVGTDSGGPLSFSFIDRNGEAAFPGKFALTSDFVYGLAHVKLLSSREKENDQFNEKGRYAYIDRTGKQVFAYSR